ncbi:MAG: transcriptional repressor LexA [Clostridia bacterium]|nr:transcriptional repressor LexA [Clostridia bacterium]
MERLNAKEKAVYDYISDAIRRDGYPPTVRDIQSALHIKSTSTVHAYLARLEEKGYIRRDAGKSRSVRVDEQTNDAVRGGSVKVPVIGRVTAGQPILAVENCEGYIDFPVMSGAAGYGQLYALRVRGESMIGAGIMDGDIIVVSKTNTAENGEIVVALCENDEATVKRFYKENGHYRLQPENPSMEPIIVDEVYILGKVVAAIRYYKR